MNLYLATAPGFSVGRDEPFGIFSTSLAAQEALQRMTTIPIDWRENPSPVAPADSWIGYAAGPPKRGAGRWTVVPFPLDGDGGLSKFVYALDSDDARDLRTLVSERLGGEDAEAI